MPKHVAVILGAGASYDLLSQPLTNVLTEWRPPLTSQLFAHRERTFSPILQKYPLAETLASTIVARSRRQSLESVLKEVQNETEYRQQFLEIPLYLQHLIGEVSTRYTSAPVNYNYLVNALKQHSSYLTPAFITLNYDRFLDGALEKILGRKYTNFNSYVIPYDFMLIKLHGCVRWGRQVLSVTSNGSKDLTNTLQALEQMRDSATFGDFAILSDHQHRWTNDTFHYPAMTVPIEGKYEYVYQPHVESLKGFLSDCQNYLVIGTSGTDRDLLDLLSGSIPACKHVDIVAGPNESKGVVDRFCNAVDQFRAANVRRFDRGFSPYVDDRDLDAFLDNCRK